VGVLTAATVRLPAAASGREVAEIAPRKWNTRDIPTLRSGTPPGRDLDAVQHQLLSDPHRAALGNRGNMVGFRRPGFFG
jgi:hypothetical protein